MQYFGFFKNGYHQNETKILKKMFASGKYKLDILDLLACIREPWEAAFSVLPREHPEGLEQDRHQSVHYKAGVL